MIKKYSLKQRKLLLDIFTSFLRFKTSARTALGANENIKTQKIYTILANSLSSFCFYFTIDNIKIKDIH